MEAAASPADAIAEIGIQLKPFHGPWNRITAAFGNFLKEAGGRIEELSISDLRVKIRAGIDAGNWQQRGDSIFAAMAENNKPVVLAIDELPILVNRMMKDESGHITPAGRKDLDAFLSWLRKCGQSHKGRVSMILSGSISFEPLLEQAGLSAHANIYPVFNLGPWSEDCAMTCLEELAKSYDVGLSTEIRQMMCQRLRCCIPHHVQMYFDRMHDHLRHAGRSSATPDDVERVYRQELLGAYGQFDMQHYEDRLMNALGRIGYAIAAELLTTTAVNGAIELEPVDSDKSLHSTPEAERAADTLSVNHVLRVLRHDSYLERHEGGYRFVSGLIEDWWRGRPGHNFNLAKRHQHDKQDEG